MSEGGPQIVTRYLFVQTNSGAGGAQTTNFTVPTGRKWRLIHGVSQVETTGVALNWALMPSDTATYYQFIRELVSGLVCRVYSGYWTSAIDSNRHFPIVATGGQVISVTAGIMAADKDFTVQLWVEEEPNTRETPVAPT